TLFNINDMKTSIFCILSALFLAGCQSSTTEKDTVSQRPNILLLSIDDLRPELGYYGNEEIITPHIDALAASSMTMLNTHCQSAVCAPSRASTMLGYRPDSTRVWYLGDEFRKV